jgi:hypothetical protein
LSAVAAFAEPTAGQTKLAERIATLLSKGDFETVRGYFDPMLKQWLSTRQVEQTWNALIAQTGEFESITRTAGTTVRNYDVVEVLCATKQAAFVVRIVFDPGQEKLNGLWVFPATAADSEKPQPSKKPSFP